MYVCVYVYKNYTIEKLPTLYLRAAAGPAENRMIKEYQYTTALQAL